MLANLGRMTVVGSKNDLGFLFFIVFFFSSGGERNNVKAI